MKRECLTCGKISENRKDFYVMGAQVGHNMICKDCASEMGMGLWKAGLSNNTSIFKKYIKIHPEAQPRFDAHMALVQKRKDDLHAELQQMSDKQKEKRAVAAKRAGCKKEKQTKCNCTSCGNVFYYGQYDEVKNVANVLHGSLYSLNQVKDLGKCPKCGSRAITKKEVYFWVDKKGNCVDVEE